VDTYLYLIDPSGSVEASDDDGGTGTNSRISRTLSSSGIYTIEATTYYASQAGSFEVSMSCMCNSFINCGDTVSGEWTVDCSSDHRSGRYARYYSFSGSAGQPVTIDLMSSVDTYFYLIAPDGSVEASDDDGGSGYNSRISKNLNSSGTYRIEATTYAAGQTGSFDLSLICEPITTTTTSAPPTTSTTTTVPTSTTTTTVPTSTTTTSVVTTTTTTVGSCTSSISCGQVVSDDWVVGCASDHRSGRYAKYYTFNGVAGQAVSIDLTSSVDTYLYLIDPNGTVEASDDDGGTGTNSSISRMLSSSGTYTIEATTYYASQTGNFELSFNCSSGPCAYPISCGQAESGSWTTDCYSEHRTSRYAKYYTFNGTAGQEVIIDLTSSVDTYLYLLDPNWNIEAEDDDSGTERNSRISRTLSTSGTYTIEATTYYEGQTGSFELTLSCPSETCTSQISCGEMISGEWTDACSSDHRSGRYAKYYTFNWSSGDRINIDLTSSVDTYLYLIDPNEDVEAEDDDGGTGTNSNIQKVLSRSGTYTIEATTYYADKTGSFEISLTCGSAGQIFAEDWNSGVIDTEKWNFVDNIISSHGGHKASVVNGELFINAWDDWTQSCGILSKAGFPINTRLSLKFKIHRIRVYNQYQSIIQFLDSGEVDGNGYKIGNRLFSLCGGNDDNRTLFIIDNENQEYSLGNYMPDQDYFLEIIFTGSETRVSVNGNVVTIPHSYPNYHIHFGGHVEDSYFDDLVIENY